MPSLSTSELGIVLLILLLVVAAGRLPRWGEALGSYLYRRRNPGRRDPSAGTAEPNAPDGKPDRPGGG